MEIKKLSPNQILTTMDFPVHNKKILEKYFDQCKNGDLEGVLPVPVVPISIGLPLLDDTSESARKYNASITNYFKEHPEVEYILCDGSHRTTALMLTHNKIPAVVFRKDADIEETRQFINEANKLPGNEHLNLATADTIEGILANKANHYSGNDPNWSASDKSEIMYETVRDKTLRMIKERVIPKYMIDFYKRANKN